MLKDWTLFEKCWLGLFTAINLFLFFAWNQTILGLVSSMAGMFCVVLVAKGKVSNYYFGIVQCATYAYVSYGYELYGEAMLNALFYLPIQFIGLYLWNRNKAKVSVRGEDVSTSVMGIKAWAIFIVSVIVAGIVYAYFLNAIGGQQVRLDSFAVVLSIGAQILMLKRYVEQWLVWIVVNVLSIILWATALTSTGGNDYTMLVMWTAFLVNSVYGYINWAKINKRQEAN